MTDFVLLDEIQPTEPPWFGEGRLLYVLWHLLHDQEDALMHISARNEDGILYKLDGRHRMIAYHLLGEEELPVHIAEHPYDRHDRGLHLLVDQRGWNDSNNAIVHRWEGSILGGQERQAEGIFTIEDYCRKLDELRDPAYVARLISTAEHMTNIMHPHDYRQ